MPFQIFITYQVYIYGVRVRAETCVVCRYTEGFESYRSCDCRRIHLGKHFSSRHLNRGPSGLAFQTSHEKMGGTAATARAVGKSRQRRQSPSAFVLCAGRPGIAAPLDRHS